MTSLGHASAGETSKMASRWWDDGQVERPFLVWPYGERSMADWSHTPPSTPCQDIIKSWCVCQKWAKCRKWAKFTSGSQPWKLALLHLCIFPPFLCMRPSLGGPGLCPFWRLSPLLFSGLARKRDGASMSTERPQPSSLNVPSKLTNTQVRSIHDPNLGILGDGMVLT
jgi:hypothetical protein